MTTRKLAVSLFGTGLALTSIALCAERPELSDAAQIIQRSVAVNTLDWNAQPEYSHRECNIKGGQSKVFQMLMIDGSPYQRLIEINGHPLSREQEQQEQAKLNREIQRRHNETPGDRHARIAKYQSNRAEQHLLMQQMVTAFNFKLAGEEQVNGVGCYVLDATPNPAYQPPVEKARVLLGMKGRLWIDRDHFHWVKVQAEVINPVEFALCIAKVKPGTKFELQQAPVGDVWLPKHFSETVNASVLGLYGMHSREEELYSNYEPAQAAGGAKLTTIAASAHALARAAAPRAPEIAPR